MSDLSPAAVPPPYRLPISQLDSLAAGTSSEEAIKTLLSAERSRRLLLLRTLLEYARSRPDSTGPLPSVDDAWDLLLRAERADPEVVNEMLADPQTGTWVAHTLRRLRDVSDDHAPLWFHVGQLHAFAIAAAIRTKLRAHTSVPTWEGAILLPSLGCLRLPYDASWGHTEVIADGVVRVKHADIVTEWDPRSGEVSTATAEWFPLRSLTSGAPNLNLLVRLDDLSAYRGLDNPVRPAPLRAAEVSRWQALLDEAWALLARDHRDRAAELAIAMTSVIPEPSAFRFRPRSTSVEDAFGCAILSEPYDAAQLSVTLIHEFQHSVLNGVRHLVDLVRGDDPGTGYAPWRNDPRPVGALIHGVFAFTAVAEFWAVHRARLTGSDADLASFEFALWRYQLAKVQDALRGHPVLSDSGERFLQGIEARLARLKSEPLPNAIATAARDAAEDQAASWRACYLRADYDQVQKVAEAWTTGQSAPPVTGGAAADIDPRREVQQLDAKAILARIRIADADLFSKLHTEPQLVAGASTADVALVAGDFETARQGYVEELSQTPDRAAAWSGLGLALAATGNDAAADIVLHRPELLREVITTLSKNGAPQPDELASWLARGAE